jgi:hypothetical protein
MRSKTTTASASWSGSSHTWRHSLPGPVTRARAALASPRAGAGGDSSQAHELGGLGRHVHAHPIRGGNQGRHGDSR